MRGWALALGVLLFAGGEVAGQGCALQLAPGITIPAGDLADAVDPGRTATSSVSCPGRVIGWHAALELEYLYGATNVIPVRLLTGPEAQIFATRRVSVVARVGAGWSFVAGEGLIVPEMPPRSDLVESGPTIGANVRLVRSLSEGVSLVGDLGARLLFSSSADVEFGTRVVEGFDEVVTLPVLAGLRIDL